MGKVRIIAANAFREVLHQRLIYSVAFLTIVIGFVVAAQFGSLQMANEAGEAKAVERMGAGLMTSVLGIWSFAALIMGVSLGSAAVSKEAEAKTIVTVLSRPVGRGEFLLGKCLGIQVFIAAVVALGIVGGCAFAWYLAIPLPLLFWFAAAEMFVGPLLACTLSVAFGAFIPRSVATLAALFLPSAGLFAKPFMHASFGAIATAVYFLAPATMPIDLIDASFGKQLLDPQYGLYAAVLSEHVLYAGGVMLLATILFSRREIRLG